MISLENEIGHMFNTKIATDLVLYSYDVLRQILLTIDGQQSRHALWSIGPFQRDFLGTTNFVVSIQLLLANCG